MNEAKCRERELFIIILGTHFYCFDAVQLEAFLRLNVDDEQLSRLPLPFLMLSFGKLMKMCGILVVSAHTTHSIRLSISPSVWCIIWHTKSLTNRNLIAPFFEVLVSFRFVCWVCLAFYSYMSLFIRFFWSVEWWWTHERSSSSGMCRQPEEEIEAWIKPLTPSPFFRLYFCATAAAINELFFSQNSTWVHIFSLFLCLRP